MIEDDRTKPDSLPMVSDPSVMGDFPAVRNQERDALIEMIDLKPRMRILDLQAAGGYVSDEVYRRLGGDVECVCLESCDALRQRLSSNYEVVADTVEDFRSIESASLDAALGLVGLHHSRSHAHTLSEVFRVLKVGAHFAVCEVVEGSAIARWLNEFVNANSANGHEGNFVKRGELAMLLENTGFSDIAGSERELSWVFESPEHLPVFFKGLFGLTSSLEETARAVGEYFEVKAGARDVRVTWQLDYRIGRRPV